MNKFIRYAQDYIRELSVKDMAFIKFCLLALGIFAGAMLPDKYKKPALIITAVVFVATYYKIMRKFLKGLLTCCD